MKHMRRKPLIPALLLAVLVFATAFLAVFRAGIERDRAEVNGLYDNTQIKIELYGYDGDLRMQTHKDILLRGLPEVTETLGVMRCPYALGVPDPETAIREVIDITQHHFTDEYGNETVTEEATYGNAYSPMDTKTLYGVSNLSFLARHQSLEITWEPGWDFESFVMEEVTPCLIRADLAQTIEPGQMITITPALGESHVELNAPNVPLVVAGVYADPGEFTPEGSILIPEAAFLNGPKLLYNSGVSLLDYGMMEYCFYRTYVIAIDPAYNREYNRIQSEVEKILGEGVCEIVSNADAMQNAARPLERKLELQSALVIPLCVLFAVAAVVLTVLLAMSFETEIFLRLMWGEKRWMVFAKLMGAAALWLIVCAGLAAVMANLAAGADWLGWSVRYAGATALLCALAAAVPMGRTCCRNLVVLYQSKEGE